MNTEQYAVKQLPITSLYCDNDFNCRGVITPIKVAELAADIRSNGLNYPIIVQPKVDAPGCPLDFRIIAGHCRVKACEVIGWTKVPCMIRVGLTQVQALVLNLGENLKRQDLNLMQEATAIQRLWEAGLPRDSVAKQIGKSSSWVQVRYNLLSLPVEIQQEAAAGILNQQQIKQIYSLGTPEEQFEAVRKIKTAKQNGEKLGNVGKKKPKTLAIKKERKTAEMIEMSELMAKNLGYGLYTRAMAWASGNITTEELFADIKEARSNAVLKLKEGQLSVEQFLQMINSDPEIRRRPLVLPSEF